MAKDGREKKREEVVLGFEKRGLLFRAAALRV
jgi:hypothetical protein